MSMVHYSNPNSPLFGATWLKKFLCTWWFLRQKQKIPCTKDVQNALKQH
jgi:hypothetical protein